MNSILFVPLFMAIFLSSVTAQSEGHPRFEPPTEQIVLQEGSLLEIIECVSYGELPLKYTWYNQSDAEIRSDANQDVFTRNSQNGSSLIFARVKHSHAGLYSCSASNRHGTALKHYDIVVNTTAGNITANETAEIVSVKVVNVTENSFQFVVQTRDDPDSFYIRYKEQLDKEESYVQIKRGENAVVKDLVPAGRYEFKFQLDPPYKVKCYNATPYYVTLLPGVPDVIFRNIRDGSVEVEWFQSVDDTYRGTIEEYELSYRRVFQVGGRHWDASKCPITIKIPNRDCSLEARYTIAGLQREVYYEIGLRLRTSAGFGKPFVNKVYTKM